MSNENNTQQTNDNSFSENLNHALNQSNPYQAIQDGFKVYNEELEKANQLMAESNRLTETLKNILPVIVLLFGLWFTFSTPTYAQENNNTIPTPTVSIGEPPDRAYQYFLPLINTEPEVMGQG